MKVVGISRICTFLSLTAMLSNFAILPSTLKESLYIAILPSTLKESIKEYVGGL